MNPPMVYEETTPSSQRAIKMIAIVPSIFALPPSITWRRIPPGTQWGEWAQPRFLVRVVGICGALWLVYQSRYLFGVFE